MYTAGGQVTLVLDQAVIRCMAQNFCMNSKKQMY